MGFAHNRDDRDSRACPHGLLNELRIDVFFVVLWHGRHDCRERGDGRELKFLGDGSAQFVEIGAFGGVVGFVFLDERARDFGAGLEEALALGGEGGFARFLGAGGRGGGGGGGGRHGGWWLAIPGGVSWEL